MTDRDLGLLKQFLMTSQMIEYELDQVEAVYSIDLKRGHRREVRDDTAYYPQIEGRFRAEAARMAPHYEVFYSLEKSIRAVVSDAMEAAYGQDWWTTVQLPPAVTTEVSKRKKTEIDSGRTLRSDDPLDFTTFGELGEIIKANWAVFGGMLSSVKAVERVMGMLNSIRGPIAHCSDLAEDEVVRLHLAMKDWFRLMG